jgi:hypothetical protein
MANHAADGTEPATVEPYDRFGSTKGNAILTGATGLVLAVLVIAQGVTVIDIGGLAGLHMFIGLALIPPVLLKLASTGYRAMRYYTGSRPYLAGGPPRLPLRLGAPIFVGLTLTLLVTGVLLMGQGNKAGMLLEVHKLSFIVWAVLFGVHFLAYASRAMRLALGDWRTGPRRAVPGVGVRSMLVTAAVGGGVVLALLLLPTIQRWHP